MSNIAAILFDLDNTLTDRYASVTAFAGRFYNQFLRELQDNMSFQEVHAVMIEADGSGYKPKDELFYAMRNQLRWKRPPSIQQMRDYWYATSPECMQLREGAWELLPRLKRRYKLGIISNGQSTVQNATIDALGIRKNMNVILISEKVGIRKPDGRIFELALRQLGVSASEAMFVGDNPDSDIRGAMQAGMAAVWLSDGKKWAGSDSPTHIIRHFHQLEDVLSP